MATQAQLSLIKRLADERSDALESHPDILGMPIDTHRQVNDMIQKLNGLPINGQPELVAKAQRKGINKYANKCYSCGHVVPEGDGFYFLGDDGKYHTHHKTGACSDEPAPVVEQAKLEPGVYRIEKDYYILFPLSGYSGLVGKKWDGDKFVKAPGAARAIRANGRKATDDEVVSLSLMAGKVGVDTSICQFCSRPLSDDEAGHSVSRGYGPTCAQRYGLPWG